MSTTAMIVVVFIGITTGVGTVVYAIVKNMKMFRAESMEFNRLKAQLNFPPKDSPLPVLEAANHTNDVLLYKMDRCLERMAYLNGGLMLRTSFKNFKKSRISS